MIKFVRYFLRYFLGHPVAAVFIFKVNSLYHLSTEYFVTQAISSLHVQKNANIRMTIQDTIPAIIKTAEKYVYEIGMGLLAPNIVSLKITLSLDTIHAAITVTKFAFQIIMALIVRDIVHQRTTNGDTIFVTVMVPRYAWTNGMVMIVWSIVSQWIFKRDIIIAVNWEKRFVYQTGMEVTA